MPACSEGNAVAAFGLQCTTACSRHPHTKPFRCPPAHLGGEVADHVGQVAAPEGGHALLRRHAGEAVDDARVAGHLRN